MATNDRVTTHTITIYDTEDTRPRWVSSSGSRIGAIRYEVFGNEWDMCVEFDGDNIIEWLLNGNPMTDIERSTLISALLGHGLTREKNDDATN